MKKFWKIAITAALIAGTVTGCGAGTTATEAVATTEVVTTAATEEVTAEATELTTAAESATEEASSEDKVASEMGVDLPDGVYTVYFDTDSSMFHVNEACEGKAELTVKNKEAVVHVKLTSKNFLHLYPGLKEDAEKEGAVLLDPIYEDVTYSDGMTEEVAAFDVPVPYLDKEFDLALIGKKEVWYDHKVSVSSPIEENVSEDEAEKKGDEALAENEYLVPVTLEGGTGKTTVDSPTKVRVEDGQYIVTICWSSKYYDYMKVDDVKYLPISEEGENSVFEIPFSDLSKPLPVIADTTKMSEPHEIEYTLTFDSSELPQ